MLVVYVTGRNLALTEEAIAEIRGSLTRTSCAVMSAPSIRNREDDGWTFDDGWVSHVKKASPRWSADAIREAVADVQGMREQESEHLNQFKQSYYVTHELKDQVLQAVDERVKGRFDEVIIYSFDSQDGKGLLDLLPASATKQTALEFVAEAHGVAKRDTVFCGDSGNDIFPLTAGFAGVLVRNADEQLVASVKEAMDSRPGPAGVFCEGRIPGAERLLHQWRDRRRLSLRAFRRGSRVKAG